MKNKHSKEFQKPLAEHPVVRTFFWHFINPKTSKHSFKFVNEAWMNFFMIQQKQKFGRTKIPVVNVEHPLDDTIPFVPEKVEIYLDFVGFFIRILSMIKRSFPKNTRYQRCSEFVDFLSTLYHSASEVYNKTLSTTNRPHYKNNFHFWVIYTFDPHFLCVPSLHIAIVAGSYAFVRKIFATDEAIISNSEKDTILNEIYTGAVNIAESVLFIKQHSINCVAAALYMLSAIFHEDFFSEADAVNFVNALFKNNDSNMEESSKAEIRSYIINLYKKLLLENKSTQTTQWQKAILDFLEGYGEG